MHDLTAFILAGGKSSRMGEEKAFLSLHGKLLIEHAIRQAKIASEIYIVGSKIKFSAFGRIVEDKFPEAGPLAGIHAALHHSKTDLNLVLAVDTPCVTADFLAFLVSVAGQNSALVTVPQIHGRMQPLCAIYRKAFCEFAASALMAGRFKVDALFALVQTSVIDLQEKSVMDMGFPEMFDNINSPEDFERVQRRPSLAEKSKHVQKP